MSTSVLKAITSFVINEFPNPNQARIEAALEKVKFKPCGAHDWQSVGFVPPLEGTHLALAIEGAYWVELQTEKKILPSSVVNRILRERVKKLEQDRDHKIGRKEKKELKAQIIDELLPRALTGQSSILAVIDPKMGFILVGDSSIKKAEIVAVMLNRAISDLTTSLADYPESTSGAMAELLLKNAQGLFAAETSLTLKGEGTPAPTVRFAQYLLEKKEVLDLLKEGMRPAELALSWEGRVSFVLTESFVLKKVCFMMAGGDASDGEEADPDALSLAMLTLQLGELRLIFKDFEHWLGKPKAAGQHGEAANDHSHESELAEAAE